MSYYQIIREHGFDNEFDKLKEGCQRIDEVEASIDWVLSRDPRHFPEIMKDFHLYKSEQVFGFPSFRLLYHVDDEKQEVTLISIEQLED